MPDVLTVAVDATGIRLTDGTKGSVKLAVCFTGTEPVGRGGKRWLLGRHVFADLAEVDPFGRSLAYELERHYGAHQIGALMLLGDGERPQTRRLEQTVMEILEPSSLDELIAWYREARSRLIDRLRQDGIPRSRIRLVASADCLPGTGL